MGKLILDAAQKAQTNGGLDEAEVYDDSGNVVGYYLPHDEYLRLRYAAVPPMTPEELEAARRDYRENGGLTTPEVLDHLRRLDEQLRGGR